MYSLYISIPFCRARCAYCDFNSYAGLEVLIPAYARAVAEEIRRVGAAGEVVGGARLQAHTVFFGGGTPSLLPLPELELIFGAVREAFALPPDAEMTLEANPGTVDAAYLLGARRLGVNRLSLGVQSLNSAELKMLGRIHTIEQAVEAVVLARAAGFSNLNLDLMMGLPGQTLADWQSTLIQALALLPDHLSAYMLALEECTPLHEAVKDGRLPEPDPDLAADMYEWTTDALQAEGFRQYEISNWAREGGTRKKEEGRRNALMPGFACRHNLTYWRNEPYLGLGPAAASYDGVERRTLGTELLHQTEVALLFGTGGQDAEVVDEELGGRIRLTREAEGLGDVARPERAGKDVLREAVAL